MSIPFFRFLYNFQPILGQMAYNYVVFDDNDIEISDMLFQLTDDFIRKSGLIPRRAFGPRAAPRRLIQRVHPPAVVQNIHRAALNHS